VTALLWFLNPELPLEPWRILPTLALYGALLGGVSAALGSTAWLGRDAQRAFRVLPWSLSAVLLLGAALYAVQASHFAYYLPAGINTRLLKAAFWLAVGGLVSLNTALLHAWSGRRYGWRSRAALWLVAVASLFLVFERREAYRPQPEPTPASALGSPRALSLIVVGLDGALPEAVLPLAEQGQLPFFDRMVRGGVVARLRPLRPIDPTVSWTTVATGKFPFRHGVRGATAFGRGRWPPRHRLDLLPVGLALRTWAPLGPTRRLDAGDRHARALWEILPLLDHTAAVIGWPLVEPSDLAPPFAFDDAFFRGAGDRISDPGLATTGRLFRPDAEDLAAILREEFPAARRDLLATSLEQDLWRATLAATLAERDGSPTVLFLRLPGLDPVSRRTFGAYSARVLDGRAGDDLAPDSDTLVGYYMRLDEMLSDLWRRTAGSSRMLVVVSPWGGRPPRFLERPAALLPLDDGAPDADGIFLALGDDIRGRAVLQDLGPEDVMPTILYALGLPQARDLDGDAVTEAFEPDFVVRQPLAFVPSYDTLSPGS
jgi:hypothetical protein